MNENTYNPFPKVTDVLPDWINSGICYSTAVYESEEIARKVGEYVRAQGGTVNGGFMHGASLGQIDHAHKLRSGELGWAVTF